MEGQLVDIEYECGLVEVAKILEDTPEHFVVTHLVQTVDGRYRFSRGSYPVPKESVAGFYDATDLEETGLYRKIDDVFYEAVTATDSDYEYWSEDDTDTDTDTDVDTEVSLESE